MPFTPIVQFGTSRFLQAHADLFVSEAAADGRAMGPITVIQSSEDVGRAKRLAGLAAGYDVRLRGIENGREVDEVYHVSSIARALSLPADLDEARRVLSDEARIILSNTADVGFARRPADSADAYDQAMSYPAKIVHLLRPRYEAGGEALQIMPTELVRNNGDMLRDLVVDAAAGAEDRYRAWLAEEVVWVNSLVDRIVSEPLEPAGAVAEPYALWAVEDRPDLVLPCTHPSIEVVDDLGVIERRKLFILNLGHTWMVAEWLARGGCGATFVRDVMSYGQWSSRLCDLYEQEVLPGFRAAGEAEGVEDYIEVTLERFANPFLDHRLEDIAQNHAEKLERRIGAFLGWARENGDTRSKPRLEAAMRGTST